MKTKFTFIIALLFVCSSVAQNGINYKAVIKDASGNILESSPISVQFSIYEGAALTNNVYQESHTVNTDTNGIVILNIGEGTTANNFADILWQNDAHFLNVQVNVGSGFVDMGTTEFKAVPYAHLSEFSNSSIKSDISEQIILFESGSSNPDKMVIQHSESYPDWGLQYSDLDDSFNFLAEGIPTVKIDLFSGDLTTEGRIGIGTDTPLTHLDVVGSGTGNTSARVTSPTGTSSLQLFHPDPARIDWSFASGVTTDELQIGSSNNNFNTGSVRMRFKPNGDITMAQNEGRVGIGTNTPSNTLSVLQPTGSSNTVRIESQDHQTGKDLLELIVPSGSTSGSQFIEMQNGTSIVAAINSDGSSKFTKIGIDGNATGKLHLFQNSQTVGSGLRFTDGTANLDWDITHGFGLRFHYGNTLKGLINASTGAYNVSSDINLKSDIQNISSVLDRVGQLRPKTYYYKDDTLKTKAIGFIAQEVNSIFPEVVNFSKADNFYGIDYASFGVIAIKAIQEQQVIIENQQKQIDELKTLIIEKLNKN